MGGRLHGSLELSAIARYSGSGLTRLRELGARAAERAMRGGPAQDQRTVQSLHLESANELIRGRSQETATDQLKNGASVSSSG